MKAKGYFGVLSLLQPLPPAPSLQNLIDKSRLEMPLTLFPATKRQILIDKNGEYFGRSCGPFAHKKGVPISRDASDGKHGKRGYLISITSFSLAAERSSIFFVSEWVSFSSSSSERFLSSSLIFLSFSSFSPASF